MRRLLVLAMCALPWIVPAPTAAACPWPAWQAFQANLISPDGRVIDHSTAQAITTSEGQAYAMFFALVADDPDGFQRLLKWTRDNLSAGDLSRRLPAWKWGRAKDGHWGVLDRNDAGDADLWLAYDLIEAGRLWHDPAYTRLGTQVLWQISARTLRSIPGLGVMLLPAGHGFASASGWRLNPSYLPPELTARFSAISPVWSELAQDGDRLLLQSSPKGFAPDWIEWKRDGGFAVDPATGPTGSYNAIRVYLWVGMLAANAPGRAALQAHFTPMSHMVAHLGHVPEKIDTVTGAATGVGPPGFSAAVLPFLMATDRSAAQVARQQHLATRRPAKDAYYDQVLALFGEGFADGRYRFDRGGRLVPAWGGPCPR